MKGYWILSKPFNTSVDRVMWMLSLLLFVCYILSIDLHMLNNSCIPGMKVIWLWSVIFVMCCCILFISILLRIFASLFIKDIGL
jgi:hypothetical protein